MNKIVTAFLILIVAVAAGAVVVSRHYQPPLVLQPTGDARMRDYILAHPDVLLESVARLQAQQQNGPQASQESGVRAAIVAHRAQLLSDPTSQVAGNPNGDVALVLFFDYRCPYCKQGVSEEKALLAADPNVKIIYKEFPILGPQSITAARAALASVRQGKYLPFHDAMMAFRGAFSDEEIFSMAQDAGIDVNRLLADMNGDDVTAILRANFALAQQLGINGTPAYVIGDHLIGGVTTADDFKKLVAAARESGAGMSHP